jgi:putative nucleotidyltransferase with HDIG domain
LLRIIPELVDGLECDQNRHHKYDVLHHNMAACDHAKPVLLNRMAALLHDVGKPATRTVNEVEGGHSFWGHERVGAEMAQAILSRLRFPGEIVDTVSHVTQHHMYVADPHASASTIRRFVQRVGVEHLEQLFELRCDDVHAHGFEVAYDKNAGFEGRVFEIVNEQPALSVRDLAINGKDVIRTLVESGARTPSYTGDQAVGVVLRSLLDEVLDVPERNSRDHLEKRAMQLAANLHREETRHSAPSFQMGLA